MKVTLHESTDGALHKTAKLCTDRNIELRVTAACIGATFVPKGCFPSSDLIDPEGDQAIMFVSNIPAFVAANSAQLRKLLNESLTAKRPRNKAKTPAAKKEKPVTAAVPVSKATATY